MYNCHRNFAAAFFRSNDSLRSFHKKIFYLKGTKLMQSKVLFSPIGSQDPYSSDGEDGAMMHIVKHYSPDKVYLYFTKEMLTYKTRCEEAIKNYDRAIEVISNEYANVENAADFDAYQSIFGTAIALIAKENPEAEILLNVTSGTSQMTLALCAEVLTHKTKLHPIQVLHPKYHPVPNRCIEPQLLGLVRSFVKFQIQDMLGRWDYKGAYFLLKNSNVSSPGRLEALLRHGYLRSTEQNERALEVAKEELADIQEQLYPCSEENQRAALDFYNVLSLKRERDEITDFTLRACAFSEELIMYEKKMKKLMEGVANKPNDDKWEWDLDKAKKNHPELIKKLEKKAHNFKQGFNTFTLGRLASYCEITDYPLLFNEDIRKLRNKAAHGVSPITEEMLLEHFKGGSKEILDGIKKCLMRIYSPPEECFDVYQFINREVVEELN